MTNSNAGRRRNENKGANVQVFISVWALGPNIWGRVTDRPLFAPRRSNVLPAPAPVSINGRHVPKHIQHTKRTLWLEEMDEAGDWCGGLGCVWGGSLDVSITEGLFVLPPPRAPGPETFPFCFICVCVWYEVFYICLWHVLDQKLQPKKQKKWLIPQRRRGAPTMLALCSILWRERSSTHFHDAIGGDMSRQRDCRCLKPQFHIWNPSELPVFSLAWDLSRSSLQPFFSPLPSFSSCLARPGVRRYLAARGFRR